MKAKITAYCAALLALLVLPFGVLAAWDKLLLGRDFPSCPRRHLERCRAQQCDRLYAVQLRAYFRRTCRRGLPDRQLDDNRSRQRRPCAAYLF